MALRYLPEPFRNMTTGGPDGYLSQQHVESGSSVYLNLDSPKETSLLAICIVGMCGGEAGVVAGKAECE